MEAKKNLFPADLGDDIDGKKRIQAVYLNSIARAISNKCKPLIKQFRKPNDTIAERIAQQIVADFILSHDMAHCAQTLEDETQNLIRSRHDQSWAARKLQFDDQRSVVSQILDAICPQNHTTTTGDAANEKQKIHVKVKKDANGNLLEDPHDVIKGEDAAKRISHRDLRKPGDICTTQDVESLSRAFGHHHHRHHSYKRDGQSKRDRHHHHSKHSGLTQFYEEVPLFTQLEPQDDDPLIVDAHYALTPEKASQIDPSLRQKSSRGAALSPGNASSSSKYAAPRERDAGGPLIIMNEPPLQKLGTPHHRIPKIDAPTMDPSTTWDRLEHPEKEPSLITKCPFDQRIRRLLQENPNYPAPPMPDQLPLAQAIDRKQALQALSKDQLVEQVVLMQEQQQMLLQQQSQLSSMIGASQAGSVAAAQQQQAMPQSPRVSSRGLPEGSSYAAPSSAASRPLVARSKGNRVDEELAPTQEGNEIEVPGPVNTEQREEKLSRTSSRTSSKSSLNKAPSVADNAAEKSATKKSTSVKSATKSTTKSGTNTKSTSDDSEDESESSSADVSKSASDKESKPTDKSTVKSSTADSEYYEEEEEEEEEEDYSEYSSNDDE